MKKTLTALIIAATIGAGYVASGPSKQQNEPLTALQQSVPLSCVWGGDDLEPCYLSDFDGDGHVDVVARARNVYFAVPNAAQKRGAYPLLYDVMKKTRPITSELQGVFDNAYHAGQEATKAMSGLYVGNAK